MLASQMVTVLVLLLALSVLTHEAPLFLLSLALLVAGLISKVWERYALARVEYTRHLARTRVPFGEDVELQVEVVNRKLLPLSWLEVEDELPADLEVVHGRVQPSYKPERRVLASLMAMRPYERLRRHYVLRCNRRGEHLFGPARLRSGDLFGFALCDRVLDTEDSLVVYPRVVPLTDLGLPSRNPLGDLRTQSWIFEDPSRIAGAREYRPGDSMRRIHWAATVRSGQLQTRLYEATTGHKLGVFLNVTTGDGPEWSYGYDPEVLEFSIVVAASVAAWGLEQGYQVGLYTNGLRRGGHLSTIVEPGRSADQLETILLALGRLQSVPGERFEELIGREARQIPFGTTAVVVSASLSPQVSNSLRMLRGSGHGAIAVLTGRQEVPFTGGISVRRVGPADGWREMEVVAAR